MTFFRQNKLGSIVLRLLPMLLPTICSGWGMMTCLLEQLSVAPHHESYTQNSTYAQPQGRSRTLKEDESRVKKVEHCQYQSTERQHVGEVQGGDLENPE